MKSVCFALLCLLPGVALAYPIEVDKQMNGAEVSYQTIEIDHDMAALALYNLGDSAAQCTAVFRNGPEAGRTRKAVLPARGETNLLLERLLIERSLSVNTAAAGGNASLMTIG